MLCFPKVCLFVALAPVLLLAEDSKKDDPFAKGGNLPPEMVPLTPEKEAEILDDVKVPDDFAVTVFAGPPAVNYPVFVAAAPDGTLYVSSDGNGSLGRDPGRGRVIRLRDLDGDGRADETKVFCEIDAPRGLVWDHDRLYLVHPPHLSAFIDRDGDGVADEQKVLVEGIAFGYEDRPADHTTNGLTLGIDGWLYIAGGDFGFMNAVGSDGRTLQHRGGGVIRVKPDGSNLELFATGTRNIVEVAVSPLMDLFARDNTNDGGGWDVRFHHLTGLADHGYPRLYKNFPDECITPLADYGGGSGCGSVYIDEPGFGEWNDAPFTADWGTGALYHHAVKAKGATFEETRSPEPFIRLTRPTDADVDAMSNVYCASWKGATFRWEGPEVGFIVRVTPKDFKPEALPDFSSAENETLEGMLSLDRNPSHRRRLEALRELQRRGKRAYEEVYALQFEAKRSEPRNELDQIYAATSTPGSDGVEALLDASATGDDVTRHTAIRALGKLGAAAAVFERLDATPANSEGLCRALAMMHTPEAVTGLIDRLSGATDSQLRRELLAALCRLHFSEGEWKGNSWGTRPDTRGPYYQPEPWSETPRIAVALKDILADASPDEAAFLVEEMSRNRIESEAAIRRLLALAEQDPGIIPQAVDQLASSETVPEDAVPLLTKVIAEDGEAAPSALTAKAVVALAKTESAESYRLILATLPRLAKRVDSHRLAVDRAEKRGDSEAEQEMEGLRAEYRAARGQLGSAVRAFVESPKLENHHLLLETEAAETDQPAALWADAALLKLSAAKKGSPEARELSLKALEAGWREPRRRAQIIQAAAAIRHREYGPRILAALADVDSGVKSAAEQAVRRMRLKIVKDDSPSLATLQPDEAISRVLEREGDTALGENVFNRATCNLCHSVNVDEPERGPYLGNIAQTYKRGELAQSILEPNKSIAQGFTSELITLEDGTQHLGFIVREGATEVTFRDAAATEFTVKTAEISERQKLPHSLMPPGLMTEFTVHEFASLLDYLESLAKKP